MLYLVGNPNCGKTTLFNQFTGLRQKTGNFAGVTIEKKFGKLKFEGKTIQILDLPGTTGFASGSPEQIITLQTLLERQEEDRAIFVMDGTMLERGLLFLLQVIELGIPSIAIVTMADVMNKKGISVNLEKLGEKLKIPFFLTNAKNPDNLEKILSAIFADSFRVGDRIWTYAGREEALYRKLVEDYNINSPQSSFVFGQCLQKSDSDFWDYFPKETKIDLQNKIAGYNFGYEKELIGKSLSIKQLLSSVLIFSPKNQTSWEARLDSILLHPIYGFVAFFSLMGLLFQTLFNWAELPMQWIENGIGFLQLFVRINLPNGPLQELLSDGILGGVGTVVAFVPQIAILFFFLGLLEESGYLARVSFLMDKTMGRFGISGKSFIPLLSSAACAVPAILSTRTIESREDRLTTILVSPFVMCSARYPVYILVVGTVFPGSFFGIFNLQGIVLFFMFVLGILVSLLFALLFRRTVLRSDSSYFLLELPKYLVPKLSHVLSSVWMKVKNFLVSAGQIILYVSVVLWFLSNFPNKSEGKEWVKSELKDSYAREIGNAILPLMEPLGFDWKISLSLLTSFAAREVMVSTLAILYTSGNDDSEESENLRSAMRVDRRADGSPLWSPLLALSLLSFFAFASQCMSTLAVVKKETGSGLWAFFQFAYMTSFAYLTSFAIYQIGKALGFG